MNAFQHCCQIGAIILTHKSPSFEFHVLFFYLFDVAENLLLLLLTILELYLNLKLNDHESWQLNLNIKAKKIIREPE